MSIPRNLSVLATSINASGILGIAAGGTGASTASAALTALGAAPVAHTHSYQAADGDLLAIGGLTGTTGLLKKTAADTWTLDTTAYTTNLGTVTGVTGTAPVVSSGGTTPEISMAAATASVPGYLTAANWTTFNNKQVALGFTPIQQGGGTSQLSNKLYIGWSAGSLLRLQIDSTDFGGSWPISVTGSAASITGTYGGTLTSGQITTGLGFTPYNSTNPSGYTANTGTVTGVTGTAPVVSSGGTAPAISMAAATTSVPGYLTAADWNTFNNKQAAGSYLQSNASTTYSGGLLTVTTLASALGSATTGVNTLQIFQATAGYDAFQTFHVGGDYAVHFGLDGTTNDLFVGGYSAGAVKNKIWHAGNLTNLNQLTNGPGYTTNLGTVTGVTGTAPVVSSGGTAPAISMAAANTSVAGYLTAADWNTFNGKQAALGFTPYNSTNPSGYITSSGSITGNAATASSASTAPKLNHVDGPRDLSNRSPSWNARSTTFDFVGAGTGNGTGNYAGVMTFAPWDGTSASTGDSSYQLSFANQSGVNASGPARLSIRNGINTTWNSWQEILTSSNYNSYSPSLTGGSASGTWGINVTGSSASAGYASTAPWDGIQNKPTTTYGYGITNALTSIRVSANGSSSYIYDQETIAFTQGTGIGLTWQSVSKALIIKLADTTVTAGTYTAASITVDAQGRLTAASSGVNGSYLPLSGGTLTGPLTMSSAGLYLNRAGGTTSGISWYSTGYRAWSTYMSNNGAAGSGPMGNITPSAGTLVTSWALRNTVENSAGYGWTWESGTLEQVTPTIVAELRSSDGAMRIAGAFTAAGAISQGVNQVLHAGNYTSYSPTLTGGSASGTWGISVTGSAATLASGQSTWSGTGVVNNVVGMLAWKNYSNSHVIFDASNSTTPSGTACNNTDPGTNWSGTYPTLMGWNGAGTYGVRVDVARYADSAGSVSGGLTTSNYNSYSPTLTGGSASGTWGISITGNAANVTGTVAIAKGGTGATTAAAARTALGAGTVTSVATGTGLTGGTITTTGTISLANTAVTAGSYTTANITVDAQGRITAATSGSAGGSYLPLSGGAMTGSTTIGTSNYIRFGPNPTWASTLQVGGDGTNGITRTATLASVVTTNGNLHLDSGSDKTMHLNFYSGTGGIIFGNGAQGQIGSITAAGALTMNGNITAYSDERLKKDWRLLPLDFVQQLSLVKVGTYTRTDSNERQIGVSAQSLQNLMPEAVIDGEYLSVAYGNAALASAVELAKEVVSLNARIARLEALVSKLIEG